MIEIADAWERQRALDVTASFCVTAPAGSGKTELLIQRFLALLPRVARPEQVLAITFTRKAAAEMLERVSRALALAKSGAAVSGAHETTTRDLALAALTASAERDWNLMDNLSCLNIKTIDSFCMTLTRQMPLLSQFGGQATVTEQPEGLYREAVSDLLSLLDTDRAVARDLRELLLHFDNDWAKLEQLLVSMLGRREQWHQYTGTHLEPEQSEQQLSASVAGVIEEYIAEAAELLSPHADAALGLLRYAMDNLGQPSPDAFPGTDHSDLAVWQAISELLLTAAGEWRKSVNKNPGFPTGENGKAWKQRHADFIVLLSDIDGLKAALQWLRLLPDMRNNSDSWRVVQHLSHVLPNLAACLLAVCQRSGTVDYSQVTQAALDALGDDDSPTELALRLDYRIEHILVDEFQDTAINQFNLVTRLSRGWGDYNATQPHAPRTLFVVGDGMQSIYGFRDASVGLFIKARNEGFNGVALEPLQLRSNFRSEKGIVEWVNRTFSKAFPRDDNPRRGRVGFSEAVAVKSASDGVAVSTHGFIDPDKTGAEAGHIARAIADTLAENTDCSIAVLGRGRSQLRPVLGALREAGISYAAEDIDLLASSPAVLDLLSLCRALANPVDTIAWYSLLRAPWCGLTLPALLEISKAGGHRKDPLTTWQEVLLSNTLEVSDRQRLSHVTVVLQWARDKRDRLGLRAWIESTWLKLGGPDCLSSLGQLRDAEVFLTLIDKAASSGVGLNMPWLDREVDKLYAASDQPDAPVVVMTLHKAKGLEFDHVFIPGVATTPRSGERDLLMWDEHVSPDGERGFLLAADDHSKPGTPSLYNFLREHQKEKSRQEVIRLLYVGATRAVRTLTLTATLEMDSGGDNPRRPSGGTLVAPIWPAFEQIMQLQVVPEAEPTPGIAGFPQLVRLRTLPDAEAPAMETGSRGGNIPERADNLLDRIMGTVVHSVLEELASSPALPFELDASYATRVEDLLSTLGLADNRLEDTAERVQAHINNVLRDEDGGRWILSSDHSEAACELPITWVDDQGTVRDSILDRTFVEAKSGERWIIDYKTSVPLENESLDEFSSRELAHYREQLTAYGTAMSGLDQRPIRCALYFTGVGHLAPLHP